MPETAHDRRWRIQAFWRVGDEWLSYAPSYVGSEAAADEAKREMEDTLWHFVDLDVRIDVVSRAEADANEERLRLLDLEPQPSLHFTIRGEPTAVCGMTAANTTIGGWDPLGDELRAFSLIEHRCRECSRALGITDRPVRDPGAQRNRVEAPGERPA